MIDPICGRPISAADRAETLRLLAHCLAELRALTAEVPR